MFDLKQWKNRISEYPNRRALTKITSDENIDIVDVTRSEGIISQDGDAFSAENMNDLETRISTSVSKLENNFAYVCNSASAPINFSVGSYLVFDGTLCRVTKQINKGTNISVGYNVTQLSVGTAITELNSSIANVKNTADSAQKSVSNLTAQINKYGKALVYVYDAVFSNGQCDLVGNLSVLTTAKTATVAVIVNGVGTDHIYFASVVNATTTSYTSRIRDLTVPNFSGNVRLYITYIG